jgi:putative membrane protein
VDLLFAVRGTILPSIAGRLAALAATALVAIVAARMHPGVFASIAATPFTLAGIALSIFMSFRNSACLRSLVGRPQAMGRADHRLPQSGPADGTPAPAPARALPAWSGGLCAGPGGTAAPRNDAQALTARLGDGPWQTMPNPCDALLDQLSGDLLDAKPMA